MFTKQDEIQIHNKAIDIATIEKQIQIFKSNGEYIFLHSIADKPDNIIVIEEKYNHDIDESIEIISFIPSSGAATRMFKALYSVLEEDDCFNIQKTNDLQSVYTFFNQIKKFAFYPALIYQIEKHGLVISEETYHKTILEYLLGNKGLNYGSMPKALILFHKENNRVKYAFEEHISEASFYSKNKITIHYTLSSEHVDIFKEKLKEVKPKINVQISIQEPSTDTIAVNPDNTLFRNADNSLLFRPAGHGALINNLNKLNADVILIKNIDNVVPDSKKPIIIEHRKKMINYILFLNNRRNLFLQKIESAITNSENIKIDEIELFLKKQLCVFLPSGYNEKSEKEKLSILHSLANRPMRVCGVVKNEGEPGGGPFVVEAKDKSLSLQIVESSQIDHNNPQQEKIYNSAKYFNPVDLVCITKRYDGSQYNLLKYVDENAVFISEKSKDGKPLKALELPGLWNGGMSNWITIFAEVPLATFNPVKTVNDLLRPSHQ